MLRTMTAAAALAALAALSASGARAEDRKAEERKVNPQHQRMADCNKAALDKGMKGEERKTFMGACLKDKQLAQQNKLKKCNADAAGMKGEERKTFLSACLKA